MLTGIALVGLSVANGFADVTVDVTQVKQNWPWSHDVAVSFTLAGTTEPMDIDVTLSSNGKTVQMPFGSVFGEATSLRDGTYTLKIDPTKTEFANERMLTDAKVSLTAVTERLYMVVDLTAGINSLTSADVTFRNTVDGTGTQWTDEYKTNKLVLKRIKASTFKMGNPKARSSYGHETPQHDVTLSRDYYLGVYELTIAQHKKLGVSWPVGGNDQYYTADEPMRPAHCLRHYTLRGGQYTQFDALRYPSAGSPLGKLRTKTGGLYIFDYPTEAQWENAAHAGHDGERYDGIAGNFSDAEWNAGIDSAEYLKTIARTAKNTASTDRACTADAGGLARVGSYAANDWGFYDMLGNVAEWVSETYCYGFAGLDPIDPFYIDRNPAEPYTNIYGVLRGGDIGGNLKSCRSTYRSNYKVGNGANTCGTRLSVTVW